jgi:Ni,Fe-hydrogenase I large subunit
MSDFDDNIKRINALNKFREVSALKDIKAESEKKNKILKEQNEILKKTELQRQREASDLKRIEEAKLRSENQRLSLEKEKQQEIDDNKERRDTFFNLKENFESILKIDAKLSKVEKYVLLKNISRHINHYRINTNFTENFDEKKIIKDFLDNLNDKIKTSSNELSKSDLKDVEDISELFGRDKSEEIGEIKFSKDIINYNKFLESKEKLKEKDILSLLKEFKEDIKKLTKI